MPSADGSRSYIAMIKQVPATPTVIPATPVLQKVNFTDDSLDANITTKKSKHIRDDRGSSGLTVTGYTVGGGYNFEFQYENSLGDELLASFLWADGWTAGGSLTEYIKNGVFYQPYYIERGHTDIAQYFKYKGMACNILSISLEDQSDVMGSYEFVGLNRTIDQAIETGATYTDQASTPIFSTVTNIPEISIDGVAVTTCKVKSMDMKLDNKVTPKTGIGVFGACETKPHSIDLTGKLTMYFEDETMAERLLNGTKFALTFTLTDSNSESYKFTLPSLQLDTDKINVTDVDEDVMEDASYVASHDDTLGCMIMIERTHTP